MSILAAAPIGSILQPAGTLATKAPTTAVALETIYASLLPHQRTFCEDTTHRKLGLVCGFGAGKTAGLVAKACTLAAQNIGFVSALFEPTAPMVRDILERSMNEWLDQWEIPYTFRASPLPEYILHFEEGTHTILLRTMENHGRLRGHNLCSVGFDEGDTSNQRIAENATRMALARLRAGNIRQFFAATTPEGFGWAYKTFKAEATDDTRLIQARTEDNPHLPADFIPSLIENYPSNLIKAYLQGEFVNLTSGQVYNRFDRAKHVQPLPLLLDRFGRPYQNQQHGRPMDNEVILAGVDFNVSNSNAVLFVKRGSTLWAFDEVIAAYDTDAIGQEIRSRYPNHRILGYPDASGNKRTTNATRSDIAILDSYQISNQAPSANPPVRDRIAAVQALLENGKGETSLYFDPACKKAIECMELQSYNEKGDPDKDTGYDHLNDAIGYVVHRLRSLELGATGRVVKGIRLY